MKTYNATDAKNRLGEVLEAVPGDSVLIEKNGRAHALVLGADLGTRLILSGYVHGEISRSKTMALLGIAWYGNLLDALQEENLSVGSSSSPAAGALQPDLVTLLGERIAK